MWPRPSRIEPTKWDGDGAYRVLIEHHDPAIAVAVGNLLVAEGYDVAYCQGPDGRRGSCPLLAKGFCERAAEADVVFFGLHLSDETDREVLGGIRAHFADTPVIVEMPVTRIPLYAAELEGCTVVPQPLTRDSLLQAVDRALR